MPISIECPACDEAFAVADSGAGKKVACPRCGNVNRIPGVKASSGPSAEKTAEQKSQLKVAKRLSEEEPTKAAPPPQQPPQIKPPVATSSTDTPVVTPADDAMVSIRSKSEGSSPPSERRRTRKKTPAAMLWGTIALGGVAVISLAFYTNQLESKKLKQGLANRNQETGSNNNTSDNLNDGKTKQPAIPNEEDNTNQPPPNEEPFKPFENEKEPDDPLVKGFGDAEKPVPTEPEDTSSIGQFTPDAVKSLFQQCQDLQWQPETLSDYAKLQGLAKLITDCGRAGENETFDADQKEAMLKAAVEVMETLSTTSWGDQLQIASINKLATEALQNRQEPGVFAYAEVYAQANGQLDGANVVFFKLLGTDQHVAVTVKENSGQLTTGTRWLILGEFNFLRTIQLMDGNTGNTIKACEVIAYYVIEEPK
jgi:predicted Zn finger-like uncharacterized protein